MFTYESDRFRVESHGWALLGVSRPNLAVELPTKHQVIAALFGAFGLTTAISDAGRVTDRLIAQMGGIFACDLFRYRGVRRLISRYSPLTPFTRSAAVQTIRDLDPATNVARFEAAARQRRNVLMSQAETPDRVFSTLLEQQAFRAGLKLLCPNCQLEFWLSLDDVQSVVQCELCGHEFAIVTQLRDRDWWYRRSGIFGKADNQQGGIPVALTLLTLLGPLGEAPTIFVSGTKICSRLEGNRWQCEADFVVVTQDLRGDPQLAIGECKSESGEITEQDVHNLEKVAAAFPASLPCFLVFSKPSPFSPAEIDLCRRVNLKVERAILISERELHAGLNPGPLLEDPARMVGASFFEMARTTSLEYFGVPFSGRIAPPRKKKVLRRAMKPLAILERIYNEHHSLSGKLFPKEMQCECEDCSALRGIREQHQD
jgi:hypothetical protein